MTCRGYDPKAVKVPKSVKALYSVPDHHERRALIKSYVRMLESENKNHGSRSNK